ncbi:Rho guanine nucleotide exchange factor scd1 [Mycena sanguinolenta]|uniref:Rho guanine nucleotide exchange factor scd1 n=1 Tax=Mycena sanguinolenta TaxID=230812 RepID=A0A8H6YMJ0_9AGAR|nr:Rho guanine nucleotide exchange factor scd1 [Mycena sanguinolenta]
MRPLFPRAACSHPTPLYLLFSNVERLLVFQRAFLSRMEVINKFPWQQQRWGRLFIEAVHICFISFRFALSNVQLFTNFCSTQEEDFVAAYQSWVSLQVTQNNLRDLASPPGPPVSNRILQVRKSLTTFNRLINFRTELPAFVLWPISRSCKYPLLIESGLDAAKRVADRLNTACRLSENVQTAKDLRACVVDWQGHDVDSFSALLYDDERLVVINFNDAEIICRVFLFERIMLFLATAPGASVLDYRHHSQYRRTTPLVLEGYVHVANIMQAQPNPADPTLFNVLWAARDNLEVFTLRFKYESQMRWWETEIKKLIRDCAERKAHERDHRRKSGQVPFNNQDDRGAFDSDDNFISLAEEASLLLRF